MARDEGADAMVSVITRLLPEKAEPNFCLRRLRNARLLTEETTLKSTDPEKKRPVRVPDASSPAAHPKAYDEPNVDAQKIMQEHPKTAHAVDEVHEKESEQEHRETPPPPAKQKED